MPYNSNPDNFYQMRRAYARHTRDDIRTIRIRRAIHFRWTRQDRFLSLLSIFLTSRRSLTTIDTLVQPTAGKKREKGRVRTDSRARVTARSGNEQGERSIATELTRVARSHESNHVLRSRWLASGAECSRTQDFERGPTVGMLCAQSWARATYRRVISAGAYHSFRSTSIDVVSAIGVSVSLVEIIFIFIPKFLTDSFTNVCSVFELKYEYVRSNSMARNVRVTESFGGKFADNNGEQQWQLMIRRQNCTGWKVTDFAASKFDG
jgi:hypothetical protein